MHHLLGKQIAAESDPASEHDGGEIGTVSALSLAPGLQRRGYAGDRQADKAQEPVVGADGAELAALLGSIRA